MANTCHVCRHATRASIDAALQQGVPLRQIAGQYGPSRSALQRHKAHVPPPSQATADPRPDQDIVMPDLRQAIAALEGLITIRQALTALEAVIARCRRHVRPDHTPQDCPLDTVLRQSAEQLAGLQATLRRWTSRVVCPGGTSHAEPTGNSPASQGESRRHRTIKRQFSRLSPRPDQGECARQPVMCVGSGG
jgi:hypothetical protein